MTHQIPGINQWYFFICTIQLCFLFVLSFLGGAFYSPESEIWYDEQNDKLLFNSIWDFKHHDSAIVYFCLFFLKNVSFQFHMFLSNRLQHTWTLQLFFTLPLSTYLYFLLMYMNKHKITADTAVQTYERQGTFSTITYLCMMYVHFYTKIYICPILAIMTTFLTTITTAHQLTWGNFTHICSSLKIRWERRRYFQSHGSNVACS